MMPFKYTDEMLAWLSDNRTLEINEYAKQFNDLFDCDKTPGQLHSLRKRKKWKTGRSGRFEKEHTPSQNARPKGANKTSFKKGDRPHNWRPVGTEVICTEGYRKIKTAEPNIWEFVHIRTWEKVHGKVPEKMVLIFKDGNELNCSIDNLELVTRAEHLRLNKHQYKHCPEQLKPTVLGLAKLEVKTFEKINNL